MVSPTVGFVGGVDGIFKTTDGGQNWTLLPYFVSTLETLDSIYFQAMNSHYLYFENESVGYSVGWDALGNREFIIKTTDGGQTWEIQHYFNPDPSAFQVPEERLRDIERISSDNLVAVGYRGRMLITTDGGQHWETKTSNTTKNLEAVDFFDAYSGIAAGDGIILLTQDGGNLWTEVTIPHYIKDCKFLSLNRIVAITESRQIITSSDGGNSWSNSLFTPSLALNALEFINASIGFISAAGDVYKTEDGGQTWYSILSSVGNIHGASFSTLVDGCFVSDDGKVYITHDGGSKIIIPPTISGIAPLLGKAGDKVIISGSNLENVTHTAFNGMPATYSYKDGSIEAYVPLNATTGKISITVPGGQTVYTEEDFTVSFEPILHNPSPYFHVRGYPLVLSGINLEFVHTVKFDSRSMPFEIIDGKIAVTTEPDIVPNNNVVVQVVSDYGTAYLWSFRIFGVPNVRSIELGLSKTGSIGSDVKLYGDHLQSVTAIEFQGGAITNSITTDNNYYSITAKVPAGAKSGRVKVYYPNGYVAPFEYLTIVQPPQIDSIRPLNVKSGDRVSVYGKNLGTHDKYVSIKLGNRFIMHQLIPIDETQIDFIVPSVQGVFPVELTNFGGSITSAEFLTISGTQPYVISNISPLVASNDQWISVAGFFPMIDSVKIGHFVIPHTQNLPDILTFKVPVGAVSGRILLYKNNAVIESDTTLLITDFYLEESITKFYPQQAAPLTYIYVNCGPLSSSEILEFSINGVKIPYMLAGGVYPNQLYRLWLPENVTTGKITMKTKSNVFTTEEDLVIVAKAGPVIHNVWNFFDAKIGPMAYVYGDNLEDVDSVFFDLTPAEFTRLHKDTLLVSVPRLDNYGVSATSKLIVKSPYGFASVKYELSHQPYLQDIIHAEPLIAKRGTEIIVTLEPKKTYIPGNAYGQIDGFYFNGVYQSWFLKIDDTHYRVRVPMEGDVNGKIGVKYFANGTSI